MPDTILLLSDCPLCGGVGGWEDTSKSQSVLCPLCNPNRQSNKVEWPEWLTPYNQIYAKYHGAVMLAPPDMIVMHRAAYGQRVAGYFEDPKDGRRVSAHFAWHPLSGDFAQCVSLRSMAWHAGGSVWNGDRILNDNSIGIEMPGPIDHPISQWEHDRCRELVVRLVEACPSIVCVIGHADGDPANRKDPGPQFDWSYVFGDLGLRCPHLKGKA